MSKRALKSTLLVLGAMAIGFVGSAAPTLATTRNDPGGYIEICKTFSAAPAGAPQYQGTFTYGITDAAGNTTYASLTAAEGGPQICTAPLYLKASGAATVTEYTAPWFSVASITATPGDPGTVSSTSSEMAQGESVVDVPASTSSANTATVQYVNDPVDGTVEVCKTADAASGSQALSGTYSFTLTSEYPAITTAGSTPWSTTATATIDPTVGNGTGCSQPIIVPAGVIQTVENGQNGLVSIASITSSSNGTDTLLGDSGNTWEGYPGPNLGDGVSYEWVNAGGTTNQSIVTYADKLSTVKLCKAWGSSATPPASFSFALSSSGLAGPTAVSSAVSLAPGTCEIVGAVRTGTMVKITEAALAGTKVQSITDNQPTVVPGSTSLPNGTISVYAGPGETDVTFTDVPAADGQLKICVTPTAGAVAATVNFAVAGGGVVSHTDTVALSATNENCVLDGGGYSYDGQVTLAGAIVQPSGGTDAFTATPTINPTLVQVFDASGSPANTDISSMPSSTSGTATVNMSEGEVTEIDFTIDPPAAATQPPVTVTEPPVASTNAPVITPGGGVSVTPVTTPVVTPVITNTVLPTTNTPITTTNKVTVGLSAKVRKLEKQFVTTNSQVRALERKLQNRHLSRSLRKADQRKLAGLRKLQNKLARELKI